MATAPTTPFGVFGSLPPASSSNQQRRPEQQDRSTVVPSQPSAFLRTQLTRCDRCGQSHVVGTECDTCARSVADAASSVSIARGTSHAAGYGQQQQQQRPFQPYAQPRHAPLYGLSSSASPRHSQPHDRNRLTSAGGGGGPSDYRYQQQHGVAGDAIRRPQQAAASSSAAPRAAARPAAYNHVDAPIDEMCFTALVPGEHFGRLLDEQHVDCQTVGDESGNSAPSPAADQLVGRVRAFVDLRGLRPELKENMYKVGYTDMTTVQQTAIPLVMAGAEVLMRAETGHGKTLAFLVPVVNWLLQQGNDVPEHHNKNLRLAEPKALVLCPTRELAIQVYDEARKLTDGLTVKVSKCYGGTEVGRSFSEMRGADLIVATCGRLMHALRELAVNLSRVHFFVLDEGDKMVSAEADDFGDVRTIRQAGLPTQVHTIMCSATWSNELSALAREFFKPRFRILWLGGSDANKDVQQRFEQVCLKDKQERLRDVIQSLVSADEGDKAELHECMERATQELGRPAGGHVYKKKIIVFVARRRNVDYLSLFLDDIGLPNFAYHGAHYQGKRESASERFKRGERPVLLVTDVAARGLDIANVSCVINYDLPGPQPTDFHQYIHRIGRTGRAGNSGESLSFFDPAVDGRTGIAAYLVKVVEQVGQQAPHWLHAHAANMQ